MCCFLWLLLRFSPIFGIQQFDHGMPSSDFLSICFVLVSLSLRIYKLMLTKFEKKVLPSFLKMSFSSPLSISSPSGTAVACYCPIGHCDPFIKKNSLFSMLFILENWYWSLSSSMTLSSAIPNLPLSLSRKVSCQILYFLVFNFLFGSFT